MICTSPVSSPTSNLLLKSRNFWLLIVLMGLVYTALTVGSYDYSLGGERAERQGVWV